ncbi:hypothetical protein N0V91_002015 [Didymella pomorum]|uniref:RRM domain-containing protein n=1 Tax=Didymella pomorum TaxID=749634 RepID=A0A9W9DAN6_9PLEO|nr:hypothetical protein N0V91_002015 [Didymella pomorum]
MQDPPLTIPMGDMTNMQYAGPPGMPVQNMDPRRRPSQHYSNGNALYDPYEDTNPAFRNAGYSNGNKYNRSSMHNNNGRPRKPSLPGSRPYHGQYPNARQQVGGHYNSGPKSHMDNDPSITQDPEYGCDVNWIGRSNKIVNELFMKDLPENTQPAELEELFQARLGVKLTSVNIRFSPQAPYLKHAFVGFPSCAVTKQALAIPDPTIHGFSVSITVPKRFFQKTVDVQSRDTVEAGPSAYSRFTSNPNNREGRNRAPSIREGSDVTPSTTATREKTSYSPQDARSDLPKKKNKQTQQAQVTAGSPEARKVKPQEKRPGSPMMEEPVASAANVQTDNLNNNAKVEGLASAPTTIEPIVFMVSEETDQPQVNEKTVSPPTVEKEMDAKPAGTEAVVSEPDSIGLIPKTAPSKVLPAVPAPSIEPTVDPAMTSLPQPPMTTIGTKVPTTASTPPEVQDPTSDDELKNEASFHSAAESKSELEVKGAHNAISGVANHGTDVRFPEASTAESVSTPAPPAPTTHPTQEADNAPTEDVAVTTDTENSHSKQDSKTTTMSSATSEAAEVQAATQQETKTRETMTFVVGQTKERGPQQPEALFPSRKQMDKLAKKEREKQRKAAKRAEGQRKLAKNGKGEDKTASSQAPPADGSVEKAKSASDKTAAPKDETQSAGNVQSLDTTATSPTTTPDAEEISASTKESTATDISQKTADNVHGTSGKGKSKKVVTPAAEELASTEDKNKDHGKQINGTSVTSETGSMTNKEAKVNPEEIVQEMSIKKTAQESARGTDAQSSKQASGGQVSGPAGTGEESPIASAKKKKNKKKQKSTEGETSKQPLAWPKFDFRLKSPNPSWMGPIDMQNDVHNYGKIMDDVCGGPEDSDFSWSDLRTMEDVMNSDKDKAPAGPASGSGPSQNAHTDEAQRIFNALFPKLKKLRPNKALETYARLSEMSTLEEMAKFAALVAKVDAATRPSQRFKDAPDDEFGEYFQSIIAAPAGTSARELVASSNREELVNRGVAALHAQIGKQSSNLLNLLSLTPTAIKGDEVESEDVVLAANGKQHAERSTGQDPSDSITPDAQPPKKKKKANKQNNKKMKKKYGADNGEPSQSGDAVATTAIASTPPKVSLNFVDPSDQVARQLDHVNAVIDLNQNGAAASGSVSLHRGAATPTEEPTLKRAVEAYLREAHPERKSKGRKALQQDLQ